jgi:hypothetical protein
MNAEAFALRRRLYIIFKGEEGLDYGGVSRYDKKVINNIALHLYYQLLLVFHYKDYIES